VEKEVYLLDPNFYFGWGFGYPIELPPKKLNFGLKRTTFNSRFLEEDFRNFLSVDLPFISSILLNFP